VAIEAVEAEAVVEQNAKSATLATCSLRARGSGTPSQPAIQNDGSFSRETLGRYIPSCR
jgi:hypothetical protein